MFFSLRGELLNVVQFLEHTKHFTKLVKEFGAISVVDCWEDDVPEGKLTSMPMAVQKVRNEGMQKLMEDPRALCRLMVKE